VLLIYVGIAAPVHAGVDFLGQSHIWENLSGLTVITTCYLDIDDPDSTFGQGVSDYFVWPEDDAGAVAQVALVDFVWDSIFGYGPAKIPNPGQVDSTVITGAWLYLKLETGGDSDSITLARSAVDLEFDGSYPQWDHPQPGENWTGGGAFDWGNDAVSGSQVTTDTLSIGIRYAIDITGIWRDFTDNPESRTGLLIKVAGDDSHTLRMYNAHAELGNSKMYVVVEWDEFGVTSTAIDSQQVAVRDSHINGRTGYEHYNYGAYAFGLLAGKSGYDSARAVIDAECMTDSLGDGLNIDSARCYFTVQAQAGSPIIEVFKIIRPWVEGSGTGFGSACGVDWIHRQHATGTEGCATNHSWVKSGCDSVGTVSDGADREAAPVASVNVTAAETYFFSIPDSIADGMYQNRDVNNFDRINYNGFLLLAQDEANDYAKIRHAEGATNPPRFVFYHTLEVEPDYTRRWPAFLDEPVEQGAYLR